MPSRALLLIALLLGGCPDADEGDPTPDPTPDDEVELTDEQVLAVLDVGVAEMEARPDWTAADKEAAAAVLLALPEVAEAGVDDESDTVWAMYADGGGLALVDNRRVEAPAPARPPTPDAGTARAGSSAWSTNTLGTHYAPQSATVAEWLDLEGWKVAQAAPTIDVLRSTTEDLALLYLDAHGGRTRIRARGPDTPGARLLGRSPRWVTGIQTATRVTRDSLRTHRADVRAGQLFLGAVKHDDLGGNRISIETFFFFSPAFVVDHMALRDDAFVFVNACDSYDATLLEAFGTIGASVFWGWDKPVRDDDAGATARFAFDAMLGVGLEILETPPYRPFGWLDVYEELQRRNLDVDQDGAELFAAELGDGFSMLLPGVREVVVNQAGEELVLFGTFGERPGEVSFGNADAEVREWSDTIVRAALPGAGGGDVRVEVDGRLGNIVPVSEWQANFHYYEALEGGVNQYDCTVGFRADVHRHRVEMADEPRHPTPQFEAEFGSCDWSMSGSFGESVISGSGTVGLGDGFSFGGEYDLESGAIRLTSWSITAQGEISGPGGTQPIAFMPSDATAPPHPLDPLVLSFDTSYNVEPGSRRAFSWDRFVADPAPSEFTPAR